MLTKLPDVCYFNLGLFENPDNQPGINWEYSEDLHDGRSLTASTFGITSEDRYALNLPIKMTSNEWVKWIRSQKNKNKILKYIDINYGQGALKAFNKRGFVHELTISFLFDTVIQHGDGSDLDSFNAILKTTDKLYKSSKVIGEYEWLKIALKVRRAILEHAHDADTRAVWAESVSRVDWYSKELFKLI
jgi:Glycosyl hydrolase family 46